MLDTQTQQSIVRCRCTEGHVFSTVIHTVVNIQSHPKLLDFLTGRGLQPANCSICSENCPVAEPLGIHDPVGRRYALFVPDVLSHRVLNYRSALVSQLAKADVERYDTYFENFQVLVGKKDLNRWRGPVLDQHRRPTYVPPVVTPPGGTRPVVTPPGGLRPVARPPGAKPPGATIPAEHYLNEPPKPHAEKPALHAAFADLVHSDSNIPPLANDSPFEESSDDWSKKTTSTRPPKPDSDDENTQKSLKDLFLFNDD